MEEEAVHTKLSELVCCEIQCMPLCDAPEIHRSRFRETDTASPFVEFDEIPQLGAVTLRALPPPRGDTRIEGTTTREVDLEERLEKREVLLGQEHFAPDGFPEQDRQERVPTEEAEARFAVRDALHDLLRQRHTRRTITIACVPDELEACTHRVERGTFDAMLRLSGHRERAGTQGLRPWKPSGSRDRSDRRLLPTSNESRGRRSP